LWSGNFSSGVAEEVLTFGGNGIIITINSNNRANATNRSSKAVSRSRELRVGATQPKECPNSPGSGAEDAFAGARMRNRDGWPRDRSQRGLIPAGKGQEEWYRDGLFTRRLFGGDGFWFFNFINLNAVNKSSRTSPGSREPRVGATRPKECPNSLGSGAAESALRPRRDYAATVGRRDRAARGDLSGRGGQEEWYRGESVVS